MTVGKVPLLTKFLSSMKDQDGWMLHMDDYYSIAQTRNEVQWPTFVALCSAVDVYVS